MNINEIRDAALNGRTFRFTGKINSLVFENGKLNIDWVFPDAGKPFSPSVDLSYIELAPKYDPCRLFRKGDRVKTRSVFGRKIYIDDALYEVMWDESCNKISVKDLTSAETLVGMPSVFFELVTPVEELEPYYVEEQDPCYVVGKRQEAPEMEYVAGFSKTRHPNAKAAAEPELCFWSKSRKSRKH